jgi:hypothetical protein
MNTSMKFNFEEHILYNTFLAISKIPPMNSQELLGKYKVNLIETNIGKALSKKDYQKIIFSEDVRNLRIKGLYYSVERYEYDQSIERINKFNIEIEKNLDICNNYINKLNYFHSKYSNNIDFLEESSLTASFLLFIKVINLLHTISDLLSKHNLSSLLLFRSLNEAILLAEYFLLADTDKKVEGDLKKWFRIERSPHIKEVIKKINLYGSKYVKSEISDITLLIRNIQFDALSKPIHNTYSDMLRFAVWEIKNNTLKFLKFNCDKTNYLRDVLIHVLLLQSNILTAFISFQYCFEIINKKLSEDDISSLNTIRKELEEINTKGKFKTEILSSLREANFNF